MNGEASEGRRAWRLGSGFVIDSTFVMRHSSLVLALVLLVASLAVFLLQHAQRVGWFLERIVFGCIVVRFGRFPATLDRGGGFGFRVLLFRLQVIGGEGTCQRDDDLRWEEFLAARHSLDLNDRSFRDE